MNKVITCNACHHFCKIEKGKTGICGVRQNISGEIKSLVFGLSPALGIDPIEKKPFYHFLPSSNAFSFGALGCNFVCKNCQNFSISQMYGEKGKVRNYEKIYWGEKLEPQEIIRLAKENKCRSIAYTYNEPTIFWEYALETMKLARKEKIKNVWVSNGFMSDMVLGKIIPYLDAINIDIKSFDENFYKENCGARLAPVLENCKKLVKEKVWLEITTLVIPGLSDDLKMLKKIAVFIKEELGDSVPWHISAFLGKISWKLKDIEDTSPKFIEKVCEIGKKTGLKYVYSGNITESSFNNTYCPKCKKILIARDGYEINKLFKGSFCSCGEKIEGIW